jgi:hypothetical protein
MKRAADATRAAKSPGKQKHPAMSQVFGVPPLGGIDFHSA